MREQHRLTVFFTGGRLDRGHRRAGDRSSARRFDCALQPGSGVARPRCRVREGFPDIAGLLAKTDEEYGNVVPIRKAE